MRAPRRSREPAGRCLPSADPRRGEDEHHAPDLKRTHDGHLRPAEMVRYQLNVSVIDPHRIPTSLGPQYPRPQESHGQNGIIWHTSARLLAWAYQSR